MSLFNFGRNNQGNLGRVNQGVRTFGTRAPGSDEPGEQATPRGGELRPKPEPRMGTPAQKVSASVPRGETDYKVLGGLRFRSKTLTQVSELVDVSFHRIINDQLKIAAHMYSRIAVAKLSEGGKECAVFADPAKVTDDEVIEIVELMEIKGFHAVEGYLAASTLVLSLSQGHVDAGALQRRRQIQRSGPNNALFAAFVDIVAWAYDAGADDLDFALDITTDQSQIAFKIGGKYVRPVQFLLHTATMHQMLGIAWQLSDGGASHGFDTKIEQQAKINIELPPKSGPRPNGARIRLRWSGLANDKGTVVTMRLQRLGSSAMVQSLEQAGYLDDHMRIFRRTIRSEGGMVCLSGVVGSGKSTSLAGLLRTLPNTQKIQSIEDPVELDIPNAYQSTVTRDLASSQADPAFLSKSRAIFRSALDVLYLGEIRDIETGGIARQVLESGHTVYTTTHAASGIGCIDRFASPQINIPRNVLAAPGILKLLVYQSLMPVNCPHCAISPDDFISGMDRKAKNEFDIYWGRIESLYGISRSKFRLRNEPGCPHCRRDGLPELNGFKGRTVVCEMVEFDDQMLSYIREERTNDLYRHWMAQSDGRFDSLNMTGKTSMECAIYKAGLGQIDPREIEERFRSFEVIEEMRERNRRVQTSPKLHAVVEAA